MSRWSGETSTSDFEISILVDQHLRQSNAPAVFRGMNHLVFAALGSDWFGWDLLRKRMFGVVSLESARDEKFWNEVILPITLGVMGCSIGVVPMHCACLEWRGEGLLLAGRSGAGKSTLTAALAQSGFTFLSDDWTYISKYKSQAVAHGLAVPIKLLPDTERFFDVLENRTVKPAMNGELAFEVSADVFQSTVALCTRPRRLLLLDRQANSSIRFERIGPGSVRSFLERSSERLPNVLHEARQLRSNVIEAVASLDVWQFTYSGSPHDAATAVRTLMEG